MVLQPPTTADYATLEDLVQAVQTHAVAEGYAVVKGRSKAGYKSGVTTKVGIICEPGGKPRRKPGTKQRKTGSIKCG